MCPPSAHSPPQPRRPPLSQPLRQPPNVSKTQWFLCRQHGRPLRRRCWCTLAGSTGGSGRSWAQRGPAPSWPPLVGLHGPALHAEVPHLHRRVVLGHHVPTTVAELHVGDGGDNFREGPTAGVFRLFKNWKTQRFQLLFKHLRTNHFQVQVGLRPPNPRHQRAWP